MAFTASKASTTVPDFESELKRTAFSVPGRFTFKFGYLREVSINNDRSACALSEGAYERTNAATPAVVGDAIDVPENMSYVLSGVVDKISTPGAKKSTLFLPKLEKSAGRFRPFAYEEAPISSQFVNSRPDTLL